MGCLHNSVRHHVRELEAYPMCGSHAGAMQSAAANIAANLIWAQIENDLMTPNFLLH